MKKTTWVIIGLSICVVVLATALGVILFQNKTETIRASQLEDDLATEISLELQTRIDSFNITPIQLNVIGRYFNAEAYRKSHPGKMFIVPGNKKGLKSYHSIKATTYSVSKEK